MTQRILIIEDEPQLARLLQLELQFESFEAEISHDGLEGLNKFLDNDYDLVLLDVNLPGMDGFEVLEKIRHSKKDTTPVILLTAKDDIKDKVAGLNLGANDYVTKPFEFEELLARINVNLRFSSVQSKHPTTMTKLQHTTIEVDIESHEVHQNNKQIDLTPREFDLLVHFMQHKKQVQSREQILNAVWGFDYYGDTNVVDVYVRYLRQKLGNTVIQTMRGVGYVMKEE